MKGLNKASFWVDINNYILVLKKAEGFFRLRINNEQKTTLFIMLKMEQVGFYQLAIK
ncbi:hypothetical protein [Caldisphaera sp.]|uniref:hypothetical protein n=1 Tax=Caldisphaera sp. TaxID=2060322 RepID=UPI00397D05D1